MSEPTTENPKTPKRSKRKPAMEPLGWDEIVSQPGMGGYLSFLNGPVPLPHLQPPPAPEVESDPVVDSASASEPAPISQIDTENQPISLTETVSEATPGVLSIPHFEAAADAVPAAVAVLIQGDQLPETVPAPDMPPGVVSAKPRRSYPAPEVVSIPAVPVTGRLRIRKCVATHDGHSLGEEVLYQALWKAATAESADTRTIVIGWRGMSQLCRMTPKNCKINTQRLIRKLALEVLSPYNTPESIGTTYRVYADEAILRRRRDAGLEWVVRSRGVEFVDPTTGLAVTAHLCGYALS